jgi:beta-barrel assembly-enhancing protease
MHTFEASYYNGQKSYEHKAQVSLQNQTLLIAYTNEYGQKQTVYWEVERIKKNLYSDSTYAIFQYGEFPYQSLQFPTNSYLAQQINSQLSATDSFGGKLFGKLRKTNAAGIMLMLTLCVGFLALTYFYIIPTLAVFSVGAIPQKQEVALGEYIFQNLFDKNKKSEPTSKTDSILAQLEPFTSDKVDDVQTKYLNKFVKTIDFQTDYPLQVTVVESDMVNAFALPGGHIVVFTGILDRMKSSNELAALLGHEVAHVTERHSLKNIVKALSSYAMVSIVTSDVNSIVALLADQANSIYNLGYSRELEKEADLEGLKTLEHNHLDKKGMPALMQTLQAEMKKKLGDSEIPSFMSSHPLTAERISYTSTLAKTDNNYKKNEQLEQLWQKIKQRLHKK